MVALGGGAESCERDTPVKPEPCTPCPNAEMAEAESDAAGQQARLVHLGLHPPNSNSLNTEFLTPNSNP